MLTRLQRQIFGQVFGLVVQFLLGMAINLFVSFPSGVGPGGEWEFTKHSILIMSHLILGSLLLINAVVILIQARKAQVKTLGLPALCGLISLLVAWASGDTFVSTQIDALSYMMSVGFLAGIFSYVWLLVRMRAKTAS